ncbi:MAG: class I SAM-dependent methyltransferase [Bacteroidia bacterium]
MKLLTPENFPDYELIDSGNGEKLERFGKYILIRPEPQAVWSKSLQENDWKKMAHARFMQEGSHSGNWDKIKPIPDQWYVSYSCKKANLRFRLGLTAFKHVGIFPEQAVNWDFIYESARSIPQCRVLNLFAYTGGASLAASAAGADVIHCDSVKNVLNWANHNMQSSGLDGIRWLLEDAFKYTRREARRGNTFHGIILDPPAYGHGPKGEKWKLEDMINELAESVAAILDKERFFLVFNSYSLGFSPLVIENLVSTHFSNQLKKTNPEKGELYLQERSGRKLPAGIFVRFSHS